MGGLPVDFKRACWMLILAVILDGLDGMIAVLTRSCSRFGIQYDSLADLVSFGVAPAVLLVADFQIREGGQVKPTPLYWAMTVVLVVCVALRLARFNVQASTEEKKSFQGLPSPTPAAFIALLLISFEEYQYALPPQVLFVVVVILGILMVSSIPYPSVKKSDFFRTQPISALLLVVFVFALIVMEPVGMMLSMVFGYILFGIIMRFLPNHLSEQINRWMDSHRPSPRQP
jgi:CDP-diacylglycerol--serine O-phosphatidyltransferase